MAEEGQAARIDYGVDALPRPSKALFSGDRNGYDEAFQAFRKACRHEALGESWFQEQLGDDHWFQRHVDHFIQLVDLMAAGAVVPFVGAGISASAGFSSWKEHLRHQGKTAHIAAERIEELLAAGAYETVLEEIEAVRGREVFINEIRDEFSRNPTIPDVVWRISELFTDTVITTNYGNIIRHATATPKASPTGGRASGWARDTMGKSSRPRATQSHRAVRRPPRTGRNPPALGATCRSASPATGFPLAAPAAACSRDQAQFETSDLGASCRQYRARPAGGVAVRQPPGKRWAGIRRHG